MESILRLLAFVGATAVVAKIIERVFASEESLPTDESLREKAKQGDDEAQFKLGEVYEEGRVVKRDYQEAHKWFNIHASLGLKKSIEKRNYLSKILNQQELEQSQDEASQWFKEFLNNQGKFWLEEAEQGNGDVKLNLGNMYANGQGVPQNYREAYKWLSIANALGVTSAKSGIDVITKQMSPQQIKKAQAEADWWLKKFSQKK